jgi:excisionase family DNA binding protein
VGGVNVGLSYREKKRKKRKPKQVGQGQVGDERRLAGDGNEWAWAELMGAHGVVSFDDEFVDELAGRIAERLKLTSGDGVAGFVDVDGAAQFLACPRSRIYALVSARRIPHHRDGSRLLFDLTELRDYVHRGGARRP